MAAGKKACLIVIDGWGVSENTEGITKHYNSLKLLSESCFPKARNINLSFEQFYADSDS